MGEVVLPQVYVTNAKGADIHSHKGVDQRRSRSYGSQSIDSGVEDGDGAFVLVLDSVMHSPTLER